MKLFLSWSGDVSKQISYELRDWIQLVLPSVKPFLSSADVDKGSKWHGEISKELSETNFGLICLTRENLTSQWLAFEAGAISKDLDGKAATLLLGIGHSDVRPPLSLFQGCLFEKDDFLKLLKDINKAAEESERRPDNQIDQIFDKFWPDLKTKIDLIIQSSQSSVQTTPQEGAVIAPKQTAIEERVEELLALARHQNVILSAPERFLAPLIQAISELVRDNNATGMARYRWSIDPYSLDRFVPYTDLARNLAGKPSTKPATKPSSPPVKPETAHVAGGEEIKDEGENSSTD